MDGILIWYFILVRTFEFLHLISKASSIYKVEDMLLIGYISCCSFKMAICFLFLYLIIYVPWPILFSENTDFFFFNFMFTNVILYPVYLFLSAFSHYWVKFTVNPIHFNHQHLGSLELNSHPYVQSLGSLLFHSISHYFGETQYLLILVKQFKLTINCSLCTRLWYRNFYKARFLFYKPQLPACSTSYAKALLTRWHMHENCP